MEFLKNLTSLKFFRFLKAAKRKTSPATMERPETIKSGFCNMIFPEKK
jgi:hypothetical protein